MIGPMGLPWLELCVSDFLDLKWWFSVGQEATGTPISQTYTQYAIQLQWDPTTSAGQDLECQLQIMIDPSSIAPSLQVSASRHSAPHPAAEAC